MADLAIPITAVPREAAQARRESARYRDLVPRELRLTPAHARAFRLEDGHVIVSIPLAGTDWSGGAFSFTFKDGLLVGSQQLIILQISETPGALRLYSEGVLTLEKTSEVTDSGPSPMSSFTDCHNSMPGWLTDLVSLMCGFGCLFAASPPTMIMCLLCMVGLGGMYASYALKCLAKR